MKFVRLPTVSAKSFSAKSVLAKTVSGKNGFGESLFGGKKLNYFSLLLSNKHK